MKLLPGGLFCIDTREVPVEMHYMPHSIEPDGHRVPVVVNSTISTENAAAWRNLVETYGGSVEMAFDALLAKSAGTRLSPPKAFHKTLLKLRTQVNSLDTLQKGFCEHVEADYKELEATATILQQQVEGIRESLGKFKMKLNASRARLKNLGPRKALDETVAALDDVEHCLDDFEVEGIKG